MNCHLLNILVDLAQIFTPFVALGGFIFVWLQIKKQTDQLHSDRLLSLYQDLDTEEAQADRKFLYNEFPKISKPTAKQIKIARRTLASLDRMSYQVIRKFVDRKSAFDLYGRVLMKVMKSTWQWLNQDRQQRNDPKGREYCNNAEQLAKEFAEQNLRLFKKWKVSYKVLPLPVLLEKSIHAHEQETSMK